MKTCKADGCYYPVWGGGYCQRHQYHRTDKKAKKDFPLKAKITTVRHFDSFGFDNQSDMFQALWEQAKDKNGIVTCPYTEQRLNRFYGTDLWYNCFAHILPKGRYTYFKLNPDNIRVVYPDFHRIIDQGTRADREKYPDWKWDEWDALVLRMKDEYIKFKQKNLLS